MFNMSLSRASSILSFNEIKVFSPEEREQYVKSVILDLLSKAERGTTIAQVSKVTNFNRITVARHLESLVSIREAYKKQRGSVAVYFKNGRLLHEADKFEIRVRDKLYAYYKLSNEEGDFIYIQEKTANPTRTVQTLGGIMIDVRDFHEFLKGLSRFGITMKAEDGKV